MHRVTPVAVMLAFVTILVVACTPQSATPSAPATSAPATSPPAAVTTVPAAGTAPASPPAKASPTAAATATAPAKPAWQADWEKTVAAAKQEGKLVLQTAGGVEMRNALTEAMRDKFGVEIEWVVGRGGEITTKMFAERQAGLFLVDMHLGGAMTPGSVLKPAKVLAPIKPLLVLPEVLDPKAYFDDGLPYVDNEGQYIFCHGPYAAMTLAVNSELVKPGEIKGYADLLDPKWKGKLIIQDPSIIGAGSRWYLMTASVLMTPDYHRGLLKQDPIVTRDKRIQVESVARGKYLVALAPDVDAIADFQKVGAPLKWILPKEGNYLSSGASATLSIYDRAPHPNASKLFANWLLTKEGLTLWSKSVLTQTARRDVPTDFLYPEGIRDPNIKYINSNKEDMLLKEADFMKQAAEIYAPLIK